MTSVILLAFQFRTPVPDITDLANAIFVTAGGRMLDSDAGTFLGSVRVGHGDAAALARFVLDRLSENAVAAVMSASVQRPPLRDLQRLLDTAERDTILLDPFPSVELSSQPQPVSNVDSNEWFRSVGDVIDDVEALLASRPVRSAADRQLNIWIDEHAGGLAEPLVAGETYTLCCNAGEPHAGSLSTGEAARVGDVPAGGLRTEWTLVSRGAELAAPGDGVEVERIAEADRPVWLARFPLLIPENRDSVVRSMKIIPRSTADARISVIVDSVVGGDRTRHFRAFAVDLEVSPAAAGLARRHENVAVSGRLAAETPRGWQGSSSLTIAPCQGVAVVSGTSETRQLRFVETQWPSDQCIATAVERVAKNAEAFRVAESGIPDRINDIDADDLIARLESFAPIRDWSNVPDAADARHRQAWSATSRSAALRNLADAGYGLYEAFFPSGTHLRHEVDRLAPGDALEMFWSERNTTTPHVPWGLMFRDADQGESIDPMAFLGLRLRITYIAHESRNGETSLGTVPASHVGVTLYRGDGDIDAEAQWQRRMWERPRTIPRVFTQWLRDPEPQPMPILYYYCRTATDAGEPILLFGENADAMVRLSDFGWTKLTNEPLVFANACATSAADPDRMNEFEHRFFKRHCRAYIGTECRVGARLASRFAYVFHDLFERASGGRTITAGEAIAQTRLFLWSRFRNIGGLFYSLINQSELYFLDGDRALTETP